MNSQNHYASQRSAQSQEFQGQPEARLSVDRISQIGAAINHSRQTGLADDLRQNVQPEVEMQMQINNGGAQSASSSL